MSGSDLSVVRITAAVTPFTSGDRALLLSHEPARTTLVFRSLARRLLFIAHSFFPDRLRAREVTESLLLFCVTAKPLQVPNVIVKPP